MNLNESPISDTPNPSVETPVVSVVIVNYNVCEFLAQAIHSVNGAAKNLPVEIIVVDNNSVDGSVAMLETDFPDVKVITNHENVGFGKANNMAIRQAMGDYVLILNPDTILQEDTLSEMIGFSQAHPDAGAVGCQILNPDGSFARESRRSFPTPDVAFYRIIGLSRLFPRSRRFGRYNMTYLPIDEDAEVDALSGSCMMIRRKALYENFRTPDDVDSSEMAADAFTPEQRPTSDVADPDPRSPGAGLFDEAFFMYGEDLDLCFRIQQAGWKIYYTPRTQIVHYKGESTKKGDLKYVRLFYGAMLLFSEKHIAGSRSTLLTGLLRAGIMFRAVLSVVNRAARRITNILFDFLIVYLTVTALGYTRAVLADNELVSLFFLTVSPAYALGTIIGIGSLGGYRRHGRHPLQTVVFGTFIGFILMATLSYFIPQIAFSRIVVILSLPITIALLLLSRRFRPGTRKTERLAILVGDPQEASRLNRMLGLHPRPPFNLVGYVATDSKNESRSAPAGHDSVSQLGQIRHLRDLVRLRQIDDVVFAARSLSNQTIFSTIRAISDLDVQFRMLHPGSQHVIGKSSVNQLALGAVVTRLPEVLSLRSEASRRVLDWAICLTGFAMYPAVFTATHVFKSRSAAILSSFLKEFPAVLTGKKSLVGFLPDHKSLISDGWQLKPGVFSITNTLAAQELDDDDLSRAYWYYVTHQTPGLDMDIILKSLRVNRHRHVV